MSTARAHVFISGRVQGVNYRHYTRQQALASGVTGWVRNLYDGRVEAVFEGQREQIERLLQWCGSGPPSARVDQVETNWGPATGEYAHFSVRMTSSGSEP